MATTSHNAKWSRARRWELLFCSSRIMHSFPSKNTFKVLFMVCLSFIVLLSYPHHLGLLDLHCIEPVPFRIGLKFKEFPGILLDHTEKTSHRPPNLPMKNELRKKVENKNIRNSAYWLTLIIDYFDDLPFSWIGEC